MSLGFSYRLTRFAVRLTWDGFLNERRYWTSARIPSSFVLRTNRFNILSNEPSHSAAVTSMPRKGRGGLVSVVLKRTQLLRDDHPDQGP